MKDTCVFCGISSGVIPAKVLWKSKTYTAFLDIHPSAPGHTLLIPNAHYESMMDTPSEVVGSLFVAAQMLMQVYQTVFNVERVKLSVVGVDVDHFHIHIIPIYTKAPQMELDVVEQMIREKLEPALK